MTSEFLDRLDAGLTKIIAELENTRIRLQQTEKEADGLRIHGADRDQLEARVNELTAQLRQAESGNTEALAGKDREIDELRGQLADAQAGRDSLQSSVDTGNALIGDLENQLGALQRQFDEAKARIQELEGWNQSAIAERDQARHDLENARNRITELEGWNQSAITERDQARHDLGNANNRIQELESGSQSVLAERDAANAALEATRHDLEKANSQLGELESTLAESNRHRDEARDEADKLRGETASLRQRLEASIARENDTRSRMSSLIKRIEETESMIENSVGVINHGGT